MAVIENEYYYNWYTAKANPYSCPNPNNYDYATAIADAKALGSICPAGWALPTYSNPNFWDDSRSLLITSGSFSSGSQNSVGSFGFLWFNSRYDDYSAYRLYFDGANSTLANYTKAWGYSVRCSRNL